MRAYININQKAFSELAILKRTKIDLIDATIFEYIVKFAVSNKAEKQLIDNKLFVWCSYQKIIDDNPLLNINSKKAIELRLNKLIEIGLFEKFTDKSKGNKTFFNVTDLAYSLVIENTNLSNEDYQGVSKNDYYNSKLINSNLNSNIKERRENNSKFTNAKKETAPLSFSKNENIKSEINPKEIIEAYRDNISNKYSDIQEPTSFNIITQHSNEFKEILTGIMNYAKYLKQSNKKPEKLFFFIRNKIYLDYQVEVIESKAPVAKQQRQYQSKAEKTKAFIENYYARKAEAMRNSNADIIDGEVIS